MTTAQHPLSGRRIKSIRAQGYFHLRDEDIAALAFGNRFAYILCVTLLAIGVTMANIPTLLAMNAIAFAAIVLPYHPFDYVYNLALRHVLNKPELPPRSKQLKFACAIATAWIMATIALFYTGHTVAAHVAGYMLVGVALLLVTTDICIPSIIFNYIFRNDVARPTANCLK